MERIKGIGQRLNVKRLILPLVLVGVAGGGVFLFRKGNPGREGTETLPPASPVSSPITFDMSNECPVFVNNGIETFSGDNRLAGLTCIGSRVNSDGSVESVFTGLRNNGDSIIVIIPLSNRAGRIN